MITHSPNQIMKRQDITQSLTAINLVRREKNPPLVSYCILLALASATEPLGSGEICQMAGESTFGGGTYDRLAEKGLIRITKVSKGKYLYTITQAGFDEVRRIVEGRKMPSAQELRRQQIVAFNPAKAS